MTVLAIEQLKTDGGTQSRERLDQDRIDDYAEHVAELPAVVAFYDGSVYWLADGFHRRAAFVKAGRKRIPVEVKQGSKRDAVWYSLGANREHAKAGIPLTRGDRTRAINRALEDEEWRELSAVQLAEHIGVHRSYVAKLKNELSTSRQLSGKSPESGERTKGKDGKSYPARKPRTPKADGPSAPESPSEPDPSEAEDDGEQAGAPVADVPTGAVRDTSAATVTHNPPETGTEE